jgi:hypothetical protein
MHKAVHPAYLSGAATVPHALTRANAQCAQLANRLDALVEQLGRPPLPVLVQVNTSGEESKYGVEPTSCTSLAKHIAEQCKNLRLAGLMTIGQPDYSSRPENFQVVFFFWCTFLSFHSSACMHHPGWGGAGCPLRRACHAASTFRVSQRPSLGFMNARTPGLGI